MKKKKSRFIINTEFICAMLCVKIIRYIPLRVAYFLSGIFFRILFICDKRHRTRSIEHILHSGVIKSRFGAVALALNNFIHIGKVMVEFVKFQSVLTPGNINKFVSCNISEKAKKAMLDSRGTICVSAHYGNWELTGYSLAALFRPIVSLGRNLDNPKLNEYFFTKRKNFGQEVYSKNDGIKQLLISLKQKKNIGLIIDQHPGDNLGVFTHFFNQPCKTHDTPALLHLKTGAPLMLAVCKRKEKGTSFELIIKDPIEVNLTGDREVDKRNLTIKINDELEQIIKECPEQWIWAHRRWLNINRKNNNLRIAQVRIPVT
jgi:Kdo2-lipid IVA lauroyltransferase/acyltransferase